MDYYDKISKSYDELHSEEQKKKFEIVKSKINIPKNAMILDVGCGTGISSDFDCFVVGIDPSIELLKLNKTSKKTLAKCEFLPFKSHFFDFVVSLTAIQNFDDIDLALKEITRVGKNNFVISALKKSSKIGRIRESISKYFSIQEIFEEEKDIIFFLGKIGKT